MRVRRAAPRCSRRGACFNPRTHEGATVIARVQDWMSDVSIHAPMRVRPEAPPPTPSSASFNPRTHEGATLRIKNEWDAERSFNPRTHEGATVPSGIRLVINGVSIHAPMRVRRPEAQGLKVRGPNGVLRQPVQSSCALQVVMMSGSFVNLQASMTYRVRQFPGDFL